MVSPASAPSAAMIPAGGALAAPSMSSAGGGSQAPISEPVLLYDIPLGVGLRPNAQVEVEAVPYEAGVIDGVMVWFECVVADDITLTNTPDTQNHWGQLICAWSHEKGVRAGQPVRLQASLSDGALDVRLADEPQ